MKIKWVVPVIVLIAVVAVLLHIPIRLEKVQPITVQIGKVDTKIECTRATAYGIGKLMLDSVTVTYGKRTFKSTSAVVSVSLFKLMDLKKSEPTVRRYLKDLKLDSLASVLNSGGIQSVAIKNCSGKIGEIPFRSADISIHKQFRKTTGSIAVDSCRVFGKVHTNQKIDFRINDSTLSGKHHGNVAGGSLSSSCEFALASKQVTAISLKGANINLPEAVPYRIGGTASLNFTGKATDNAGLVGEGSISVKKFDEKQCDLFDELHRSLKLVGVEKVQFDSVRVPIRLKQEKIYVDSLFADGKQFDVSGSGSVKLKTIGYNFRVTGHLANSMKESVSGLIWGGLDPDGSGKKFTGTVAGHRESYEVTVDRRFIRQSVKSFFHNLFN